MKREDSDYDYGEPSCSQCKISREVAGDCSMCPTHGGGKESD